MSVLVLVFVFVAVGVVVAFVFVRGVVGGGVAFCCCLRSFLFSSSVVFSVFVFLALPLDPGFSYVFLFLLCVSLLSLFLFFVLNFACVSKFFIFFVDGVLRTTGCHSRCGLFI